jgi:predicted nucleotidyltransferase
VSTEAVAKALGADERVAYALVFGSSVQGKTHAGSDLDLAVAFRKGFDPTALEIGDLVSRLEGLARRPVDIVLIDEAPPGLAYRIFRDGRVLVEHDRAALVSRKTRAILEYLDFRPVEELCSAGILKAAQDGR